MKGLRAQTSCDFYAPTTICVGEQTFTALCSPGTYVWYINGQQIPNANSKSFTYNFTMPGTYTVELEYIPSGGGGGGIEQQQEPGPTASDGAEEYSVTSKTITVYEAPIPPILSSTKTEVCNSSSVTLSVTNPLPGITYAWASSPTGFSGSGSSLTATVTAPTTFFVVANNPGGCNSNASLLVNVITTTSIPRVSSENTYKKRDLSALPAVSDHYWQTSTSGVSTSQNASGIYQVSTPGNYYLRRYSATGTCWTAASAAVSVTINNTPPLAITSQVKRYGYNEVYFTDVDKDHILQYADYYWVSSTSGVETTDKFLNPSKKYTNGTYYLRGRDKSTGTWGTAAAITVLLKGDNSINSIQTTLFDGSATPQVVNESKNYFDDAGKLLQSQTRSQEDNSVFASESMYDQYNRAIGSTLAAPINKNTFGYFEAFVQDGAGGKYDYTDFDSPSTKYNPAPVGNTQKGTLGWYYSANNTDEPKVGKTQFPYSRTEFYEDGTGEIKRSTSPGDQHRLGLGHEVMSGSFPIVNELNDYLAKRRTAGLTDNQTDNSLQYEGVQSVVRDANGKYSVSFSDKSGNTVMSARKGTAANHTLKVTNSVTASSNPASANYKQSIYFYILDDQSVTFTFTAPTQSAPSGNVYGSAIERSAYTSAEKELIGGQSVTLKNGFYVPSGNTFVARISSGEVGVYQGLFTIENLQTGQLFTPTSGTWPAGFYKVNLVSGEIVLNYTNYYTDVSCQFYNDAGRLVSSVSPNGYKNWANGYANIDKTTYVYNHQGWLLSMTEPDAGTTQYKYRKDGKIRFSQNALQKVNEDAGVAGKGRFSYTHYDKLGRPVESGEYTGTGYTFAAVSSQVEYATQVVFSSDKKDWVKTYYSTAFPSLNSTWNIPASPFTQDYITNAVSYTENENMTTVYSYDELGRVTWMVQKATSTLLPKVFTTRYEYDFLGNVLKVSNQVYNNTGAEVSTEQFHHHYTYDKNKRLVKSYTSTDGTNRKLRATYKYYLHGPLKRVELDNKLQGIDYVYNVNGSLTHINHPDFARDPGGDGVSSDVRTDVFGMQLDYHESEMGSLYTVTSPMYNGMISSTRWTTKAAYGNSSDLKGMFINRYDERDQITDVRWANPSGNWTSFVLGGNQYRLNSITYDANGNILTLRRYDNAGAIKNYFDYTYKPNKNQLTAVSNYVGTYTYNEIGQMVGENKTGSAPDQYVDYDVSGKVRMVYSGPEKTMAQRKVEYTYDDRGYRLAKIDYTTNLTTWYVRDASGNVTSIYESNNAGAGLTQTEVPFYGSGKLGTYYPQGTGMLAYELTDHLGNVRAVLRKETMTYTATMEDNGQADITNPRVQEMQMFENIETVAKEDARFNYTALPGAEYSAYLYWINGGATQNNRMGPAIALKVEKGDTLKMETWVRYKKKVSYSRTATVGMMASLLGGSFAGGVGFEALGSAQATTEFTEAMNAAGMMTDSDNSKPYAYLNYLLLDENLNYAGHSWVRVPDAAGFNAGEEGLPNKHVKMEISTPGAVATKRGYVYIWLSNESENTEVWFDDFKVSHRQGIVAQATDFGAWGEVLREQKYTTAEDYRFGYQGQFAEKDPETGWNHFELREYDPIVARWTIVDPLRVGFSVYMAMSNNPINRIDRRGGCPNGDCPEDWWNGDSGQSTTLAGIEVKAYRYFGGRIFDRVTAGWEKNGLNYSTYGSINFGVYQKFKSYPAPEGQGWGFNAFTPFGGVYFSVDNVKTSDANDTYVTMGVGAGLEFAVDSHVTKFTKNDIAPLSSSDVGGFQVHYGLGISAYGFQNSFSLSNDGFKPIIGDVKGYQVGTSLGANTVLPASGSIGIGYTWNISAMGRYLRSR